jgi:hypothetical protein
MLSKLRWKHVADTPARKAEFLTADGRVDTPPITPSTPG